MTPLRILVVSHYYWPEPFRINQLIEDLAAEGAQVTVLTGHPNYPADTSYPGYNPGRAMVERHPAGYEICRVPVFTRGKGGSVRLTLNYLSFVASGTTVGWWLLRKKRFDVQFVYATTPAIQGYVALWFKLLKRAPIVFWVQDIWPEALVATGYVRSPLLLKVIGASVALVYSGCDLILGQSQSFVRMLRERARSARVEFFPNPGEHSPVGDVGLAPRLPGAFKVVFAGNIGRAQAMETVVAAAELLREERDVHVSLVGSGSMVEWVERSVRERGLDNITIVGRLPGDAMPAIYEQADALLLALANDDAVSQTVPSKLQSYFGAGRPTIAAVKGEAADIVIEAGAGIACAAEDPAALAAAIREIKNCSEAERAAMGRAARSYFEQNYNPDKLTVDLLGRLRDVAGLQCGDDGT